MESSLGFKNIFIFHILFSLTPGCYRVHSSPLYRDDQTSGNSVNLHHSIPEAKQSADSEHFDLSALWIFPGSRVPSLSQQGWLWEAAQRLLPPPLPHSALTTFHVLHYGARVVGGFLPPHTSLRPQHITQSKSQTAHVLPPCRCSDTFRNPGVCNSADRGHLGPSQDRKCKDWEVTEPICEHSSTSPTADPAPIEGIRL